MPVLKLHQSSLATLKCPAGKRRIEYCDSEVPGLYLLVGDTDTRTLFHRYKDPATHKTAHRKVGRISEIPLADAREQVIRWKEELSSPAAQSDGIAKPKRKEDMTLSDFWKDYYLPLAKQKKKSWDRDVQLFARIEPKFGAQKLADIQRHEIQLFHGNLRLEGLSPATSDLHAALTKRLFSLAVEYGLLMKNPASKMQMFHADNRVEHLMDSAQLGKLLEVLRTTANLRGVCQICLFLLATGARYNEALSATWDQIDKEGRVWRIPAKNTKSQRTRSVPLSAVAMEVVDQLDTKGEYAHLFINPKTKEPYVNISASWHKLRSKAGLPHLRLHDLRHGAASNLINSGASLYIVQQILGHSTPTVTQRYAHLSMQSLHDASANAAALIQRASQLVKPEEKMPEAS